MARSRPGRVFVAALRLRRLPDSLLSCRSRNFGALRVVSFPERLPALHAMHNI